VNEQVHCECVASPLHAAQKTRSSSSSSRIFQLVVSKYDRHNLAWDTYQFRHLVLSEYPVTLSTTCKGFTVLVHIIPDRTVGYPYQMQRHTYSACRLIRPYACRFGICFVLLRANPLLILQVPVSITPSENNDFNNNNKNKLTSRGICMALHLVEVLPHYRKSQCETVSQKRQSLLIFLVSDGHPYSFNITVIAVFRSCCEICCLGFRLRF
jgi:hypothetical protein